MALTFLSGSVAGDQVCTDVTATTGGFRDDFFEDLVLSLFSTDERVLFAEERDTITLVIIDLFNNGPFGVMQG